MTSKDARLRAEARALLEELLLVETWSDYTYLAAEARRWLLDDALDRPDAGHPHTTTEPTL